MSNSNECARLPHRVCVIPLDARPVCYDLPQRLLRIAGIEPCLPATNLLGVLKQPAKASALKRWMKHHLMEGDPLVVALDTLAYGGLIPSRVGLESFESLREQVDAFLETLRLDTPITDTRPASPQPKTPEKVRKVLGFSSILRIPNYNFAEEEPDYWQQYGQRLYRFSEALHQAGLDCPGFLSACLPESVRAALPPGLLNDIPAEVVEDFLQRHRRNFRLNQSFVADWADNRLETLVFCQDDTGAYGLNVLESQWLASQLLGAEKNTSAERTPQPHSAWVQTGADEVACTLIARLLVDEQPLRVYPFYSSLQGSQLQARFDGVPIETVVAQRVHACGALLADTEAEADLLLAIHTPESRQGDHCEGLSALTQPEQSRVLTDWLAKAQQRGQPVALVDVAYANGSDPRLTEQLLTRFTHLDWLYGYAGWNTPGNAIGTALAMGVVRCVAERHRTFRAREFQKLLLIRFADDWLYQSDVRYHVRHANYQGQPPAEAQLNALMADGLSLLQHRLDLADMRVRCHFPCDRTFEVAIHVP
ncbi:MAG: DUF4127 family protein [Candidatus Melainabacteria bacterium]|nr:DUF4127 family protein [Candidatus Melainabacteria bacterium]